MMSFKKHPLATCLGLSTAEILSCSSAALAQNTRSLILTGPDGKKYFSGIHPQLIPLSFSYHLDQDFNYHIYNVDQSESQHEYATLSYSPGFTLTGNQATPGTNNQGQIVQDDADNTVTNTGGPQAVEDLVAEDTGDESIASSTPDSTVGGATLQMGTWEVETPAHGTEGNSLFGESFIP